jgi:hypothetical protein
MKVKLYICCLVVALFLSQGCVEKFEPPVTTANQNFLVVDGFINNGTDSTIILLSRTRNVGDTVSAIPELHAQLFVVKNGSILYSLAEQGGGRYESPGQFLDVNSKYRLKIITAQGKEYLSDEVSVRETPPIDSIAYVSNSGGVTFSVNTHDPNNNSRYYQWEYEETWEYHSTFESNLEYVNGSVVTRPPERGIYTCYQNTKSTSISLGSSANLAEDIIYQNPLLTVPRNSSQITVRYSLLVKQYVLSQEAFTYWQNIKKTTEQLGSIFDAQPSQFKGNIHSVADAQEPVLGYMSIYTKKEKRIFVTPEEVKPWGFSGPQCELSTLSKDTWNFYVVNFGYIPVGISGPPPGVISWGEAICVDCRVRGGTTIKPVFWP